MTLNSTLSFDRRYPVLPQNIRAHVNVCGSVRVGRFVSQFLIGLEALNVRLYQRRAQVHRP